MVAPCGSAVARRSNASVHEWAEWGMAKTARGGNMVLAEALSPARWHGWVARDTSSCGRERKFSASRGCSMWRGSNRRRSQRLGRSDRADWRRLARGAAGDMAASARERAVGAWSSASWHRHGRVAVAVEPAMIASCICSISASRGNARVDDWAERRVAERSGRSDMVLSETLRPAARHLGMARYTGTAGRKRRQAASTNRCSTTWKMGRQTASSNRRSPQRDRVRGRDRRRRSRAGGSSPSGKAEGERGAATGRDRLAAEVVQPPGVLAALCGIAASGDASIDKRTQRGRTQCTRIGDIELLEAANPAAWHRVIARRRRHAARGMRLRSSTKRRTAGRRQRCRTDRVAAARRDARSDRVAAR